MKTSIRTYYLLVVLVLLSVFYLFGCSTPSSSGYIENQPPTITIKAANEYRLAPNDLIEFRVDGENDLTRDVRVSDAGKVTLPVIGEVVIANLTKEQAEDHLTKSVSIYYIRKPRVILTIKEFTQQQITVEGEVRRPGVYPIRGRTTLLQGVATAEGLTPVGGSDIKIFRYNFDGTRQAISYNIDDVREGKVADPVLQNQDIVHIPSNTAKAVAQSLIQFVLPFGTLKPGN